MREERINYRDGDFDVVITVGQARVIDSYVRALLAQRATEEKRASKTEGAIESIQETAKGIFHMYTFPTLVAGTREIASVNGAKLTLPTDPEKLTVADLINLPERLVTKWEEKILDLNPHWRFGYNAAEDKTDEFGEKVETEAKKVDESTKVS